MPVGNLSLPLGSVLTGQPEVIGSSVLAAAAASVSFQFPDVYRAVAFEVFIKKDATNGSIQARLNNDSGANYSYQYIYASGASVGGARSTGQTLTYLGIDSPGSNGRWACSGLVVKTTAAAKAQMLTIASEGLAAAIVVSQIGTEWNNTTNLLSRLDIIQSAGNFAANTSITLWGYRL